jgi:galactokinase/galacturonokinase
VPLKTHDKTFLRDVPASMRRHHCDERPPRPARRAEHFYGEHKGVKKVVVKVPVG